MSMDKNPTEKAFIEFFSRIDPRTDKASAAQLETVRESIAKNGTWNEQEEWRISTWFETTINLEEVNGKRWFLVSVQRDRQALSCKCPTIERAFMFSKLYQHIIVYQFYSVGPPWASPLGEP